MALTDTQIKGNNDGKTLYDGEGLMLVTRPNGKRYWVLRFQLNKKRTDKSLGPYPRVGLKDARIKAREFMAHVYQGVNPIEVKRKEQIKSVTLEEVFWSTFEAKKADLVNGGKAGRWDSPVRVNVLPKLGKQDITKIDQHDIRKVLEPIWQTKAPTADKAIKSLRETFEHGIAMGLPLSLDTVVNAKVLLGKQGHQKQSHPSMNWQEVPAFYASLNDKFVSNRALRLVILSGMRVDAIRHAHTDQVEGNVWTVPAKYMKGTKYGKKDFRVALSAEALALFKNANGYLFTGKKGKPITDSTMSKYMRDNGWEGKAVPHGFRATVRTWMQEARPDVSKEVAEVILAHAEENAVVRAYARSDVLNLRAPIMQDWADLVSGKRSAEVVEIADGAKS